MGSGANRERRRREAEVAIDSPEAERTTTRTDPQFLELISDRKGGVRGRRTLMASLGGLALVAVFVPVVMWVNYRLTHVITRNAQVKGTITHVGAQLDGVVASVEIDNGQQVKAGQILARFEDLQLQANYARAKSRLAKATRELEVEKLAIEQEGRRLSGRVSETQARTDAARAQVEAAKSQADDARAKLELRQTLAKNGMIAPEELRGAETASRTANALTQTAQADRSAAEATRELAVVESEGLEVRRRHLQVIQAEIAALEAELSFAEAERKAAVIRAPADGWVVRRIAEAGASVVVGQPIAALWIGNDVWVEAWVTEDDLAHVTVGNPVRVSVKPYPQKVFKGTVESVARSTDFELPDMAVPEPRAARMRNTPVVCVRVKLDQPDGLFPGLSAVVGIRKRKG